MASAASRRVILLARFYDVSARAFTVSSTLITSRNYENETWCRRWWHISHRNISLTARSFEPKLSTILMKHTHDAKSSGKSTKASDTTEKSSRICASETLGKLLRMIRDKKNILQLKEAVMMDVTSFSSTSHSR
ncbi:hypothetical protein KPH14_003891 [Odynerus spinipes]|uniref:Uncharacterized protein n=1 Tax=Odynerus spinipes TaxID=1348599 RepID=A0AAD9RXI6_9HYME|nr:hypothetical protein KPH14_003891 [Odynerus spinipes]